MEAEVASLQRLARDVPELLELAPSPLEIRGVGSVLHDFYSGLERTFERVATVLDEDAPSGRDWCLGLRQRMARGVGERRPAVIAPEVASLLVPYLRFRHLFRHSYGFNLEWTLMRPLVEALPRVLERFEQDLAAFWRDLET